MLSHVTRGIPVALAAVVRIAVAASLASAEETIKFDVAEDPTRFAFDRSGPWAITEQIYSLTTNPGEKPWLATTTNWWMSEMSCCER